MPYVQSDTLLLGDVFNNFRNMCLEIYGLDLAHFFSAPGLAWQAALKRTKVKLDLLIDIEMLLMVQKYIRNGISQTIHQYVKVNNKYTKESSYLRYWDVNNLYGWAISQSLAVYAFKWVKKTSQFKKDFMGNYNEGWRIFSWSWCCFLEVYFRKNYMSFTMIYHFYLK